jgi:hypothetical protein
MKKIKILLLSLSILLTINVFAANLDIKYTEMEVVGSNLVFDIEIKTDNPATYLAGLELYINYNTTAFGSNIAPLITVTPIGLLTQPNYSVSKANNTSSRLFINAVCIFPNFFPASNVLVTYSKVLTISIPIVNAAEMAGISSACSIMQAGQLYYPASSGGATTAYTPVNCVNDLLTLPLTPNLSLLFSEIGDPSNTTTNFIEIYNPGAAVDFTNNYPYYLSVNGSSSVQLTGTLAAGGIYTVAYNNTDFTPSLVSTLVGTGGTTEYLISIYGDYLTGTSIDTYDGTLSGFDYTGKHAVRHYNIVAPNMTPTASEWVTSAAQNIDMTAGSHRSTITWDGSSSSDWHTRANWATNFIPDAGHNVGVPSAGSIPRIGSGDNAYAHELNITGSLIIQSVDIPGGDGSLITYGTVTGNATVKRFLGADRFWYVTQPTTSATANVFLHTWMFTYNEAGSAWSPFIEDETTPLSVMKGYAVWTSSVNKFDQDLPPLGDTTTSFDGVLNTGSLSAALTSDGDGWNFVGNPYPSAVDWDAASGWTRTNLTTNAYYVWTGTTYASYVVGGPGTNGGTQYIPAGQGFFVNAADAGTLGVSNEVRTHSAQDFWKSDENRMNLLSLTVSNGSVNDETIIYFNEEATPDLDYTFDARKMMAESAPQVYTMMGTEKMSINTYNNITKTTSVTLGINAPAEGEYSLTASNLESFDASTPIYLEDVVTGQKISLREMSAYTFFTGEGASERFVVHFAEYQGIGDNPHSDLHSIYAGNRSINVDFNELKGEIVIYDILGQEISRTSANNGLNIIPVPNGNAVYVVKVISDNNAVTKKVFVK